MHALILAGLLAVQTPGSATAPVQTPAVETRDTARGVLERLEEYDFQLGPNGEIEVCGALPSVARAGAPRAEIETALRAGLDHLGCINDHSTAQTQGLVDLIEWTGARADLLNTADEAIAIRHIERLNARIEAMNVWTRAYYRDRLRPVVQDGNRRLGLTNDPIGRYLGITD